MGRKLEWKIHYFRRGLRFDEENRIFQRVDTQAGAESLNHSIVSCKRVALKEGRETLSRMGYRLTLMRASWNNN